MLRKKGSPQRLEIVKHSDAVEKIKNLKKKCKEDACSKMKQVQDYVTNDELSLEDVEFEDNHK